MKIMQIKKLPLSSAQKIKSQQYFHNAYTIIKELVENSIDAQSTHITITLTPTTISVYDDGIGTQLDLVGLPGFTSKFEEAKNVLGLVDHESFYGYRGQAISALSELADVEIVSCVEGKAYKKKIGENKIRTVRENGTSINVTNLFKNTPVRRNLLNIKAELVRIVFLLKHYLMVNKIYLKCSFNGKTIFSKSGNAEIIRALHDFNSTCKVVMKQNELVNIYFSDVSSKDIILLYRKRPLFDNHLVKMIKQYFSSFHLPELMTVMEIKVKCDCNMSADKSQVSIKDRDEIYRFINKAVEEFSVEYNSLYSSVNYSTPLSSPIKKNSNLCEVKKMKFSGSQENENIRRVLVEKNNENVKKDAKDLASLNKKAVLNDNFTDENKENDFISRENNVLERKKTGLEYLIRNYEDLGYKNNRVNLDYDNLGYRPLVNDKKDFNNTTEGWSVEIISDSSKVEDKKIIKENEDKINIGRRPGFGAWDYFKEKNRGCNEIKITKNNFNDLKIIGQFNNGFILCKLIEEKTTFLIIDQHASDEIYNYEQLLKNFRLSTRKLIIPIDLNLSPVDEFILNSNEDEIKRHGFNIENGKLITLPVYKDIDFNLNDFYQLLACFKDLSEFVKIRNILATKACRISTMIGDHLPVSKMENIVRNLANLKRPWCCPHGRPVLKILYQIENQL